MTTLTLRYGDPIEENIQYLRESQHHEEAPKVTSNDLDKCKLFGWTFFRPINQDFPIIIGKLYITFFGN